jgi:hypothetical protein
MKKNKKRAIEDENDILNEEFETRKLFLPINYYKYRAIKLKETSKKR